MKLLRATVKRLRSTKGESISEVLIALLISTLGIMLLAGMINASANMITKSKDKIKDYVAKENGIVAQSSSGAVTGQVAFVVGSGENTQTIRLNESSDTVNVEYYENSEFGNNTVKSYKVK